MKIIHCMVIKHLTYRILSKRKLGVKQTPIPPSRGEPSTQLTLSSL